jgi:hypothetical protein
MQDRKHIMILIEVEKAPDKIQYHFRIKMLNLLGIDRRYPKITKSIYNKPSVNIILSGKKCNSFSYRLGTRQECPFLPLYSA